MEMLNGKPVSSLARANKFVDDGRDPQRQELAKIAAELYIEMIFIHGMYTTLIRIRAMCW